MGGEEGTGRRAWRWIALAFGLAGLFALARLLPVGDWIEALEDWVRERGVFGLAAYAFAYVVAVLLLVPGAPLTLAGGALFGPWLGTAVVSVASTGAAGLAFLVARHLARERVRELARRHPRFGAVDRAVEQGGWRVVFLLRLSPAVPFSASNYLYGLTAVGFGPYLLASWVAMLPATFLYVYLGHVGAAGVSAASGDGGSARTPGEWALLGAGLFASVVVTVYVTRLARRALHEQGGELEGSDR